MCEVGTRSRWFLAPVFWITYVFNILVLYLLLSDLLPESFLNYLGEEFLVLGLLIIQFPIVQLSKNEKHLSLHKNSNLIYITLYLALMIPLIFVQTIKQLWGRVRFRDLAVNYIDFTPWFQPQGISGNYSFPSGHTAMGWMLLPILILLANKKGWKYKLIGGTVFIWGVIVGLGRIVIGAHYASDVLFSTGAAFVTFIILYNQIQSENQIEEA